MLCLRCSLAAVAPVRREEGGRVFLAEEEAGAAAAGAADSDDEFGMLILELPGVLRAEFGAGVGAIGSLSADE